MLQSVPVLFQRFTLLTGDSLRQGRDKGERHHRCLSEEARIIEPKFSKRTRGGRLALVIFGTNSTTGAHIASPPYYALGKLSQTVDTLVTVQFAFRNGYKPQRSISCPPSHETSPTTVCAEGSSASRMRFLSDRLVHGAKQPASLARAPRGLARRRSSRYRRPSPQARRKTPAGAPAESRRRACDTCRAVGQR